MNAIPEAGRPIEVLLVEDSPGDVRLTREAFREASRSINDFWLTRVSLRPPEQGAPA